MFVPRSLILILMLTFLIENYIGRDQLFCIIDFFWKAESALYIAHLMVYWEVIDRGRVCVDEGC